MFVIRLASIPLNEPRLSGQPGSTESSYWRVCWRSDCSQQDTRQRLEEGHCFWQRAGRVLLQKAEERGDQRDIWAAWYVLALPWCRSALVFAQELGCSLLFKPRPLLLLLPSYYECCITSRCFRWTSVKPASLMGPICPRVHVLGCTSDWTGLPQYLLMAIFIVRAFHLPVSF